MTFREVTTCSGDDLTNFDLKYVSLPKGINQKTCPLFQAFWKSGHVSIKKLLRMVETNTSLASSWFAISFLPLALILNEKFPEPQLFHNRKLIDKYSPLKPEILLNSSNFQP